VEEDLINLEKIKKMFDGKTGTRTVEVADTEYDILLKEAKKEKVLLSEKDTEFSIQAGDAVIKIQKDDEEDI
jgi:hypothetical protein